MAVTRELEALLNSLSSHGHGLEVEALTADGVCALIHCVVPGVLRAFIEVVDREDEGASSGRRGLVPLSVGVGGVDEAMLSGALHVSTSVVLRQVGAQASLFASGLARARAGASAGPSATSESALETLLLWLGGLRGMYSTACGECGEGLAWDPLLQAFAPPVFRPCLVATSGSRQEAVLYHRICCPPSPTADSAAVQPPVNY